MKTKFEWGYCGLCDCMTVICPGCGNNTCNGGSGKIDGKPCHICESAYQYAKNTTPPPIPDGAEPITINDILNQLI